MIIIMYLVTSFHITHYINKLRHYPREKKIYIQSEKKRNKEIKIKYLL